MWPSSIAPPLRSRVMLGFSRRFRLLYVVYAEVEAVAIRIISARKATKHEQARYETD